jgi:UPF0271 protein
MQTIDLNCDMGEAFGNYLMPNDEKLMDYITSANIACGFHAGDYGVMQQTVALAIRKGIAIGAHPGLPDLQGFGRREMKISPAEAYQITLYQIGALQAFVKAARGKLNHVKPHGALYNMAAQDLQLARAIVQAIKDFDDRLILYALSGSEMINAAREAGIQTAAEVFADRSYQDNGTLTPRSQANAVLQNEDQVKQQLLMMVTEGRVKTVSGQHIQLVSDTVCLHGDGEHALGFAQLVRNTLTTQSILLKAPRNEEKA